MTTHVFVPRERHGNNRTRWDKNFLNMCSFFFFFLFFVSFQIGLSSSASSSSVGFSRRHFVVSPSPPSRKALSYSTTTTTTATFRGPLRRVDDIYGDDKRVVHTGPNPLHN
ncbi:hypothetical protein CARUB_v10021181mg [Capsella rubella]|uniref:Uncharacterized protein n=1 Tax=Capsella rubella TaxID=81985 RepID=R0IGI0_9BRAS|nr:hypothetical protein CARUB_v10021181mg [Capsella rubella]